MSLFLLLTLAATGTAFAQERKSERCYGVAMAGENDGIGQSTNPGSSKTDWQGDAWVSVPRGECVKTLLPAQTDSTPRRGALEPLARDPG